MRKRLLYELEKPAALLSVYRKQRRSMVAPGAKLQDCLEYMQLDLLRGLVEGAAGWTALRAKCLLGDRS